MFTLKQCIDFKVNKPAVLGIKMVKSRGSNGLLMILDDLWIDKGNEIIHETF